MEESAVKVSLNTVVSAITANGIAKAKQIKDKRFMLLHLSVKFL